MSTCNDPVEYSPTCCQYDTDQVVYRLNSIEFSDLTALGIGRGDKLTYILEQFGKLILEMNPAYIESFGFQQKTLPDLFQDIYDKLSFLYQKTQAQDVIISEMNDKLISLTDRVNKIEKPEIVDSRGLGFTVYDKINTVLQKIADNG